MADRMNKSGVWFLMASLILMTSLTTVVSTAHFTSTAKGSDLARVAKPIARLKTLTDPANLGQIQPGETKTFDFSIDNGSAVDGVSEVSLNYVIALGTTSQDPSPLLFALSYLDENLIPHPMIQSPTGFFTGYVGFGTVAQTHVYKLYVTLPSDAVLMPEERLYQVAVQLTIKQSDT